jgi:oxygen-independent coproporphyrinogen-3 oxidase
MPRDVALYVHIPFCRRKCHYCSFVSYEYREAEIPAYLSALKKELVWRARGERVRSIYFGGGTPSLLSARQVEDILTTISSLFAVDEEAEITMEANPGTVNTIYLTAIRSLGVNRLSLGVQSLNDGELALLGRIHTRAEARDAVRFARNSGFKNLSLDLIYGLPGQTLPDWQNTLDEVIDLGPEHLSLYALSVEADTPMWKAIENKHIPDIDPDLSADQYELAEDILSTHGYRHYEISNWAKEGRECHHNMTYWENMPYLGLGIGAHSYLDGHRLANTQSLDKYLAAFSNNLQPVLDLDEEISPELQLAETVILGLRLRDGIDTDNIRSRFGIDLLECYSQQVETLVGFGLLEYVGQHVRLTRRGRLLSNEVFWRFLPG